MSFRAFLVFVIVTILSGLVWGLYQYYILRRKTRRKKAEVTTFTKRIIVPLEKCEIKTSEYINEPSESSTHSLSGLLDSLHSKRTINDEWEKVSVIVYRHIEGSKTIRFVSEPIYISPELLQLKLDANKEANIYVDPGNYEKYYFDLSFLNSQD